MSCFIVKFGKCSLRLLLNTIENNNILQLWKTHVKWQERFQKDKTPYLCVWSILVHINWKYMVKTKKKSMQKSWVWNVTRPPLLYNSESGDFHRRTERVTQSMTAHRNGAWLRSTDDHTLSVQSQPSRALGRGRDHASRTSPVAFSGPRFIPNPGLQSGLQTAQRRPTEILRENPKYEPM